MAQMSVGEVLNIYWESLASAMLACEIESETATRIIELAKEQLNVRFVITEAELNEPYQPDDSDLETQLTNGILDFVIRLITVYKAKLDHKEAKDEAIKFLHRIINALEDESI